MRRILLFTALLVSLLWCKAQPYGNEWIDYSQPHYKIKVWQDGVYRIPYSTLIAYSSSFSGINVNNFAIYHNGQQVPLFISATGSTLTGSDYIEFYGKRNIGDVDSFLYRTGDMQPHPYYSLFTDTSIYYLTIRSNQANLRLANVQNNLLNPPAKEPYFMWTARQITTNKYYEGKYLSSGNDEVYRSIYDIGEGFAGNFFGSTAQTYVLATPDVNLSGPAAVFNAVFANNSNEGHSARIDVNTYNVYQQGTAFVGFKLNRITGSVPLNQLQSSNNIKFYTSDQAVSTKQNVAYMSELRYPRNFNFQGQNRFYFTLDASPNSRYLEINNFNDNGLQPVLYDLTNGLRLTSTQSPGSSPLRFVLPAPSQPGTTRELVLVSGDVSSYTTVTNLTPLFFQNFNSAANKGDYVLIASSSLFNNGGSNPVELYRSYRDMDDNPASGRYQAVIINVDTLYDQFSYGVKKSPLAIRNFIQWANSHWTVAPKHVFLVGKAIESPTTKRSTGNQYNLDLVPTFGYPGSDNLLAASRTNDTMLVCIGRLAAQNPQQVQDYLDKVQTYEAQQNSYSNSEPIDNKEWQKRVLHFSGGTGSTEQTMFRYYLDQYKKVVEDTLWGASVTTYSKTTNAPIDQSQSAIIKADINKGVSLITFFGHSATGAFDFSIDEPENYTNQGKLPVIISNGCFAGLIHTSTPGYSERFVLEPQVGAIAFMATTSLSISNSLDRFTSKVYQELSNRRYTNTFGECVRSAMSDVVACCGTADFDMMVAYEMTLHGDPALRLNQYPKPDYAVNESSVYFNPASVTPGTDSFEVHVIVTNLGRARKDTISVSLTRYSFGANNDSVSAYYKKYIPAPYYKDTVTFVLPTATAGATYGQNLFYPYVDADYHVDEMAENNNGLTIPASIYIQNDDVIPIYPYEFAIDSQQGVTLKASTVNPFAPARNYRFEIDTSELFLAPLETKIIYQSGGVLHWKPTITYKDSVVYYWRVAIDSSSPRWRYSSFIYLAGEYPGWNQSHYYQWQKDNYLNMLMDTDRIFKFPSSVNNIFVKTGIADAFGGPLSSESMGWDYNNYNMHRFRMGGCGFNNGITFAVIDNVTGFPWYSMNLLPSNTDNWGDKFGNYHCDGKYYIQYGYDFKTTGVHGAVDPTVPGASQISNQPWSVVIKNFIDSIPAGFYVLAYSDNNMTSIYPQWDDTLVNALESSFLLPASQFKNGSLNGPFIYFTQKGNPNFQSTFVTQSSYSPYIQASIDFTGLWFAGQMTSPKIGPAQEWGSMHFQLQSREGNTKDIDTVDLIGVQNNGIETVLLSTTDTFNLINNFSAQQYPYMRLRLRTRDDSLRTPTQLQYWRILYKKAPEAAINPAKYFSFVDSVPMGGNMHVEVALENVTDIPMDSMLASYTIRDAQFHVYDTLIRHAPLPGQQDSFIVLSYGQSINSNTYEGLNRLVIEANPNEDQLEQYHFNNYAELNFKTVGDKINPLLDVTFDGQHIFNGDIVSTQPTIMVTLKDENKFLALNDSSLLDLYLKYPGESTLRRLNFDNITMKFYPADSTNLTKGNKAQVELKPTFTIDGTYELIIRDRDRSGNNSSMESRNENNRFYDYKISFEVINKPMITNILNYPNPFTTATKFIFTITGNEVPDYMRIQIMTIKGTVVKEITKEELGPIHIGRNISEYTWDGRDTYGDLLANGVYFYRVTTRLDDKEMDHMGTNYDKYFKKGFGKLVIVR